MASDEESSGSAFARAAAAHWRAEGSRFTYVRRLICETVEGFKVAFTPEDLLERVRQKDGQIALSSVYRSLSQLTEAGLLVATSGRGGTRHYSRADPAGTSTSHVACLDCGKIIPVENPCLGLREAEAARRQGFRPQRTTLRYEASCDTYHRTGSCDQGNAGNSEPKEEG
jgi:Fur family ferric uptake transcriptional regulator